MVFQIGATLLDACVLASLAGGDTYGYVLTQTLKETLDISESTLYPVLRRLLKAGALSVYDSSFQGRNRRYYAITETGREALTGYQGGWEDYKRRVDFLMKGGEVFAQ